jgi:hypothetical protein
VEVGGGERNPRQDDQEGAEGGAQRHPLRHRGKTRTLCKGNPDCPYVPNRSTEAVRRADTDGIHQKGRDVSSAHRTSG